MFTRKCYEFLKKKIITLNTDDFTNLKLVLGTKKSIFTEIYKKNFWGDSQSRSGTGSSVENTENLRNDLLLLLETLSVKTLLDAPCGDFNWMRLVELGNVFYIGCDIVDEIIDNNNIFHNNQNRLFLKCNIIKDELPKADLILCRDALVHFSIKDIKHTINNFKKSEATYLLTTTFTNCNYNADILTGKWRTLNLTIYPFHFPPPLEIIKEQSSESIKYPDKSLALWKISSLPFFC